MTGEIGARPRIDVVVVGASWGGLGALRVLLGGLPGDFAPPVVITQHRGRLSDDTLVGLLREASLLPVSEPEDKEPLERGRVYLGPADYHLLVDRGAIALDITEPVIFSRPSIDVLFESAADAYGAGVVGVILTGASHDGAAGARRVKLRGGYVIVQSPESAASRAMPEAAIRGAPVDAILDLKDIAAHLCALAGGAPVAAARAG